MSFLIILGKWVGQYVNKLKADRFTSSRRRWHVDSCLERRGEEDWEREREGREHSCLKYSLPEPCILVVGVIHYGSPSAQLNGGHCWHRTSKHIIYKATRKHKITAIPKAYSWSIILLVHTCPFLVHKYLILYMYFSKSQFLNF